MDGMSLTVLVAILVGSSAVTWVAGTALAKTTDSLDHRFNIGDAIGGLVLLGVAGSLPEIAVVFTAARFGHLPLIIGTLIGGIAIQTLLLAIFDFATGKARPLSYLAGSITISFETLFAIVITVLAVVGIFVHRTVTASHISPISIILLIAWVVGLFFIYRVRMIPKFNECGADCAPGRKHHERRKVEPHVFYKGKSNLHVILIFLAASAATLIAGYYLEESGNAMAVRFHISGGLFGATVIALATALPEISTGLESIFIGDNHLAISDILGGNAFMLVLFLFADLVARKPVLTFAGRSDLIFGIIGLAMMGVYLVSFLTRPKKCWFRLGPDSILVILMYAAGLAVLMHLKLL